MAAAAASSSSPSAPITLHPHQTGRALQHSSKHVGAQLQLARCTPSFWHSSQSCRFTCPSIKRTSLRNFSHLIVNYFPLALPILAKCASVISMHLPSLWSGDVRFALMSPPRTSGILLCFIPMMILFSFMKKLLPSVLCGPEFTLPGMCILQASGRVELQLDTLWREPENTCNSYIIPCSMSRSLPACP